MATNVLMPQMGESINEGTLTKWHKKVGDKIQREEILFEISTDKVDTEIPSPVSGVLVQVLAAEGSVVAVNAVVAVVDESGAGAVSAAPAAAAAAATPAVQSAPAASSQNTSSAASPAPAAAAGSASADDSGRGVKSSPLVRKMAAEHNVDLSKVAGSGENGRINKQD
ncbi:MAG: hypothetical protein EBR09_10205, partial [Proteobacteria bacterium]|nr:hypothetical protein [Pseudomonadota bacterium]